MFAVEFTSSRPQGAAPYYSLVVREEYLLGSDPSCDIELHCPGIRPQHVSLLLMRQSEANAEAEAAGGEGVYLELPEGDGLLEKDPLVLFLTVLEEEEGETGGTVFVGDTEVPPGGSIILTDGTEAQFGPSVSVIFHYRPLVVCVDSDLMHPDQANDLRFMFHRLGATLCEVPTLNLPMPTPIGLLHCVEELADDLSTVIALACGYSIVPPTYVLEWFATLAQKASAPLSVLPPPRRFEVPIRSVTRASTVSYARPETDTAAFSLYPIPSTAVKSRGRETLFEDKVFFFFTEAAAARYRLAVQQCGGVCLFPTDREEALHNVRLFSVEQSPAPKDRKPNDPFPENFYVIVDSVAEAMLLNEGLHGASEELASFLEEAEKAGALHVPVMGDHTLFTCLLSNRFTVEEIDLTEWQEAGDRAAMETYTFAPNPAALPSPEESAYVPYHEEEEGVPHEAPAPSVGPASSRQLPRPSESQSNRRLSRDEIRRNSLLPKRENRTPSRSQLRSYSKQRALSEDPGSRTGEAPSARSSSRRRSTKGTRADGRDSIAFRDRFDILRVRVYSFLIKEDAKVDECLINFKRNRYVDDEVVEHALEVRAQSQDFMDKIDDLLDESYGPYTGPLREFWRDCSDLDEKAQKLLNCLQRNSQGRRRSSTRRGRSGSRRGSPSSPRYPSSGSLQPPPPTSRHQVEDDAEALNNTRGSIKEHREVYRGVDPRLTRGQRGSVGSPRGSHSHVDPHRKLSSSLPTDPQGSHSVSVMTDRESRVQRSPKNPAPNSVKARRSSSLTRETASHGKTNPSSS